MKLLTELFGQIISEAILTVVAILYIFACYWVFDQLHISNPDTQVVIGIGLSVVPPLGLAFWLHRRGTIK